MFSASANTLFGGLALNSKWRVGVNMRGSTFCELTALFKVAKSELGSTVPRKIDLNWFIPALVKRRVGSARGTTGDEATVRRENC